MTLYTDFAINKQIPAFLKPSIKNAIKLLENIQKRNILYSPMHTQESPQQQAFDTFHNLKSKLNTQKRKLIVNTVTVRRR